MTVVRLIFYFLLGGSLLIACSNRSMPEKENGPNNNECLTKTIELDDSLAKIRNLSPINISLSESINNYVADLELQLDRSNCPEKFIDSFAKHIEAWEKITKITDKYSDLRGEMHESFDKIELSPDSTQFKLLLDSIWSTWAKVEKEVAANSSY